MRVCFVSPSAYKLFNSDCSARHGGAEVDIYNIATELSADDRYEVVFIVKDFGQPREERYGRVKVMKAYRPGDLKPIAYLKLFLLLWTVRADVYFYKSAAGICGVIGLFCRLFRRPFVYRVASDIDCDGRFRKWHRLEGMLYEFGLKSARAVIAQNADQQVALMSRYGFGSTVIKNAHRLKAASAAARESILWVGRGVSLKRPELFLRLAQAFPTEKFVMICPEYRTLRVDGVPFSEMATAARNLTIVDSVPFAEIDAHFAKAKFFVNTSDYEGFPNTFIQAAGQGVPILSLNVNPDGFLGGHDCGYCAQGNFAGLVAWLRQALADEALRRNLGLNARAYAEEHHDITRNIGAYKALIDSLSKRA